MVIIRCLSNSGSKLYIISALEGYQTGSDESIAKAVVLVSGGMDSLVTFAIAREHFQTALLHISYGQRTEKRELKAFHSIAGHYGVNETLVTAAPLLKQVGGSSLTDSSIPVAEPDLDSSKIPTSYVPFRNAHFLSCAVSWAEVTNASAIFIGAVSEDSSGYPDCRREFYDSFEDLINVGTKPETQIKIITPIIDLKKKDIILKGARLDTPFHLSWSCYKRSDKACGNCDSCMLRIRAFKEADLTDPIEYL